MIMSMSPRQKVDNESVTSTVAIVERSSTPTTRRAHPTTPPLHMAPHTHSHTPNSWQRATMELAMADKKINPASWTYTHTHTHTHTSGDLHSHRRTIVQGQKCEEARGL